MPLWTRLRESSMTGESGMLILFGESLFPSDSGCSPCCNCFYTIADGLCKKCAAVLLSILLSLPFTAVATPLYVLFFVVLVSFGWLYQETQNSRNLAGERKLVEVKALVAVGGVTITAVPKICVFYQRSSRIYQCVCHMSQICIQGFTMNEGVWIVVALNSFGQVAG